MATLACARRSNVAPTSLAANDHAAVVAAGGEDPAALDEILHGYTEDVSTHRELANQLVGGAPQDGIPSHSAENAALGKQETQGLRGVGER